GVGSGPDTARALDRERVRLAKRGPGRARPGAPKHALRAQPDLVGCNVQGGGAAGSPLLPPCSRNAPSRATPRRRTGTCTAVTPRTAVAVAASREHLSPLQPWDLRLGPVLTVCVQDVPNVTGLLSGAWGSDSRVRRREVLEALCPRPGRLPGLLEAIEKHQVL